MKKTSGNTVVCRKTQVKKSDKKQGQHNQATHHQHLVLAEKIEPDGKSELQKEKCAD